MAFLSTRQGYSDLNLAILLILSALACSSLARCQAEEEQPLTVVSTGIPNDSVASAGVAHQSQKPNITNTTQHRHIDHKNVTQHLQHPKKPPLNLGKCPGWLKDYATWHKATRGTKAAKYFMWFCYGGCQGIGIVCTTQVSILNPPCPSALC